MAAARSDIKGFLDAYRKAFEAFDAAAVVDLFTYPCQITSGAGEIPVTTVRSRKAWVGEIERLMDAYRAIGVRSADVLDAQLTELAPRLAQTTVHWSLLGETGAPIYDFDASYTLIDAGQGMRIAAIAHNETERLQAALGQTRAVDES